MSGDVRLLIVCTANQCRSPLGEALARRWLERRGIRATVASAGTDARDAPATATTRAVARRLGLDLSGHRARAASTDLVRSADVVIAMEVRHVLELSEATPDRQALIATLPELAEAARRDPVRPVDRPADGPGVQAWVAGHRAALPQLLGGGLDIADPVGLSVEEHLAAAARIADDLDAVLEAWFGPAARRPDRS